jgi:hypothetical protein
MAITLNATDIHMTGTVNNFADITTPFSVSTWIQYAGWGTGVIKSLVGLYLVGTTAIQIGTYQAGNVSVWTWGGTNLITSNGAVILSTTDYIHIVYTFDGTNHQLFINSALVNTTTTAQVAGVPTIIYINGYPTGGANETAAYSVDDTIYFNRQLSSEEIQTLYYARGIRDGIYDGVVARFTMSEGSIGVTATGLKDYGKFNNNLTIEGAGSPIVFSEGVIFNDTRPYQ